MKEKADWLLFEVPACDLTSDRQAVLNALLDQLKKDPEAMRRAGHDSLQSFAEALDAAKEAYCNGSYACSHIELPSVADARRDWPWEYDTLATGGESWGDLPTQTAIGFNSIIECDPLYRQLEEWARQDYLRKHAGEPMPYLLQLDGSLFRQQRLALDQLIRCYAADTGLSVDPGMELMQGLQSLLDELADQAYDHYGIDCLFSAVAADNQLSLWEHDDAEQTSPDRQAADSKMRPLVAGPALG